MPPDPPGARFGNDRNRLGVTKRVTPRKSFRNSSGRGSPTQDATQPPPCRAMSASALVPSRDARIAPRGLPQRTTHRAHGDAWVHTDDPAGHHRAMRGARGWHRGARRWRRDHAPGDMCLASGGSATRPPHHARGARRDSTRSLHRWIAHPITLDRAHAPAPCACVHALHVTRPHEPRSRRHTFAKGMQASNTGAHASCRAADASTLGPRLSCMPTTG